MSSPFHDAVIDLAAMAGTDAAEAITDEHARWALYEGALADQRLRGTVLHVLRVDPNPPLVSAAVIRALELVDAHERAEWLEVLPPGPQRDYAQQRALESGLLELLLDDVNAEVDRARIGTWSRWLQLQVAERVASRRVLAVLADHGDTKRIRSRARQRLGAP